jgi:hypothetical protein
MHPTPKRLDELAGIEGGRDITRGLVDALPYLEPTDAILGRDGGPFALDTWHGLLDEWQVFSALEQRKNAVTRTEWEVIPGGERRDDKLAAKLLDAVLNAIRWDAVTGYCPNEEVEAEFAARRSPDQA